MIAGTLSLGAVSTVFANGDMFVKPTDNYFSGFYAGLGGGISYTSSHANVVSNFYDHEDYYPHLTSSLDENINDIMGAGEIFAGFGKNFSFGSFGSNNFYLGLELFGKLSPSRMEDHTSSDGDVINNLKTVTSNYYSFGGDLRFGYLINPKILAYILLGIDTAKFKNETTYFGPGNPYGASNDIYEDSSSWMAGLMPGVGIEAMITKKLSLRTQFVYTYWGNGDFGINSTYSYPGGSDIYTYSISGDIDKIQRGLLTVDLTYHFN